MINNIISQLEAVRKTQPLIHHITNYVTVNDCANICLAIGASPIMADDIREASDITTISSSLVINIGTLNKRTIESMVSAGIEANKHNIPVILDPVGAGASNFRNETVEILLEKIKFSVIRGNHSEIRYLTEACANTKGVDVADEDLLQDGVELVRCCAKKYDCTVAITGKTDYISDGMRVLSIENGNEMLSCITGTGCMCTTLIGAFCGANKEPFYSAAAGILCMCIAGERAYENAGQIGLGSFHMSLFNEIGKIDSKTLLERSKIYEQKN